MKSQQSRQEIDGVILRYDASKINASIETLILAEESLFSVMLPIFGFYICAIATLAIISYQMAAFMYRYIYSRREADITLNAQKWFIYKAWQNDYIKFDGNGEMKDNI